MAGSRIKGITVEIGGDTTGLEKALKGVNTTIKSTQTQLKDVERLLKLDPTHTELLNQKQKLLKDSIGATKEKLDALKQAQEQANANTNVSMMGETFKYAAPIAGALGFSAEDTAQAIGLMANAGIKGSQAGTALRTIMNNLTGPITLVGENLGEVTIQTTNTDGSMRDLSDILADCRVAFSQLSESEQAQAAEALVGKNAMSGFLALMNAAPEDIDKLSSAIENCDGTAERMANTMQDNLSGQITILKSALQELAIQIGDALMPTIRKIVAKIQEFVEKLQNMDEGTRNTILKIAAFAAAIGPALLVVGKLRLQATVSGCEFHLRPCDGDDLFPQPGCADRTGNRH